MVLMNTVAAILPYIQIVISILLIISILLQRSSEGIEGAFGGSQGDSMTHFTRRGGEKFLFYATIVLAVLFAVTALIAILGV